MSFRVDSDQVCSRDSGVLRVEITKATRGMKVAGEIYHLKKLPYDSRETSGLMLTQCIRKKLEKFVSCVSRL